MLKILGNSLRTGVVTTAYPAQREQPAARCCGRLEASPGAPFSSLPGPAACPTGAITVSDGPPRCWRLDLARCAFCGLCAGTAAGAVTVTHDFEMAARSRDDLVIQIDESGAPAPMPEQQRESLGGQLRRTIASVLGRSLHLRHVDAGSCNGCDWELTALLNPVYDVQRLGIDFVASPRHADGVIVTGAVTRNLEVAVRRAFEGVPEPRLVIAVGACAASGGVAGVSYASLGGVASVLPVDVMIPGCPPRPEAVIFGLLLAMERVTQRVPAQRRSAG